MLHCYLKIESYIIIQLHSFTIRIVCATTRKYTSCDLVICFVKSADKSIIKPVWGRVQYRSLCLAKPTEYDAIYFETFVCIVWELIKLLGAFCVAYFIKRIYNSEGNFMIQIQFVASSIGEPIKREHVPTADILSNTEKITLSFFLLANML